MLSRTVDEIIRGTESYTGRKNMFDDLKGAQRFLVDFAGAFLLALIQEMNRAHHRQSMPHVILAAFLFALPIALCAYFSKKDNKKFDWKAICIYLAVFGVCVLTAWQRMGPSFNSDALMNAFKIAVWISASILVVSRIWRQVEGPSDEFPPPYDQASPRGST